MMEGNRLNTVIYFESELELCAPLSLGNGEGRYADRDAFLDRQGYAVIPGSSIAGVLYHHFSAVLSNDDERKKNLDCLWGISDTGGQSISSMIVFHDAVCTERTNKDGWLTVRDQVCIDGATGTAKEMGKFDFEAVNPGAVFRFRLEILLRDKYANLCGFAEEILGEIVNVGEKEGWRFGSRTSRGYGKTVLANPRWLKLNFAQGEKAVQKEAVEKYVDFRWDCTQLEELKWAGERNPAYEGRSWRISVPLTLDRTMNIRSYHNATWDVDNKQLTVRNVKDRQDRAVIPGTSWAGAFRSHMGRILEQIRKELELPCQPGNDELIEGLFGKEKKGENGHRSRIFFEESEDRRKSGRFVDVSRIRIDRFTGAVVSGALMTERVTVDGEYNLDIIIRDAEDYEKGLVCLAVEDLLEGGLAVGGETGIGRGIFRLRGTGQSFAELAGGCEQLKKWYEALMEYLEGR